MGWTADKETSFAIMDFALENGINFFDTADIYSFWADNNDGGVSEAWIGDWLVSRQVRDKIIIATKARGRMWDGPDGEGLSRKHLLRAVEDSLKRLQVETIDLYQSHWPDEDTPIEETLRAYEEMITQGKVRYIGCSNHTPSQLRQALEAAGLTVDVTHISGKVPESSGSDDSGTSPGGMPAGGGDAAAGGPPNSIDFDALSAALQIGSTFLFWSPSGIVLWDPTGIARVLHVAAFVASFVAGCG